MSGLRQQLNKLFRLAANPYVEFAVGIVVVISGIWQMAYELPGEFRAGELEGHHTIILFGFFIAVNSFLRFFEGIEHAVKATSKLKIGKCDWILLPAKRIIEHKAFEFVMGLILVLGGFAELFEESLGIDELKTGTDNDLLWFAALLVIGISMIIRSMASIRDVLRIAVRKRQSKKKGLRIIRSLDAFFRKSFAEGFLAAMILLLGIWHELVDATVLNIAHIEAHHGLMAFGTQRLLKFSQDISDSMDLAEDVVEKEFDKSST